MLPSPRRLVTTMSPPIRRARLREISNPNPVPPKRRDRESSPCEKRWKSLDRVAASMPMPVSLIVNSTQQIPSAAGWVATAVVAPGGGLKARPAADTTRTSRATRPCSVNLMALAMRLNSTWRTRVGSSKARCGTVGSVSMLNSRPLSRACGRIRASTSVINSRSAKGTGASVIRPDSRRDMSRMSFNSVSRWSADEEAVRR